MVLYRGVAKMFRRGGGGRGHTVSNIIVMAFSPRNIVGYLLKKGLQRGGGGGHGNSRIPPRYALVIIQHKDDKTQFIFFLKLTSRYSSRISLDIRDVDLRISRVYFLPYLGSVSMC